MRAMPAKSTTSEEEELQTAKDTIKSLETKLHLAELKYKQLFDNLGEEVHMWEIVRAKNGSILTWKLVDANPSAIKAWSKNKEDIIGKTADEIFNTQATKEFLPIVERMFAEGKPIHWVQAFEPTQQFLAMTSIPLGEYFISTGRDISQETEAQNLLRENQELLQKAEEVSNQGSFKWNIQKDTWQFSNNWRKIHGCFDPEITKEKLMEIAFPEDKPAIENAIELSLMGKGSYEIDHRVINQETKEVRWVRAKGKVYFSENGTPLWMVGVGKDITTEIESAKALEESEKKYKNIAENLPGIVLQYLKKPDGTDKLLYISQGVNKVFEVEQKQAMANNSLLWERVHPEDLASYQQSILDSEQKLIPWSYEHRLVMPDGRIKWLFMSGTPSRLPDGSTVWDSIGIDITELKQAKEALEELNNHLEKRVEERTQEILEVSKSLELYRLAAEHAESGVWYFDCLKDELWWDHIMYDLYKIKEAAFSGAFDAWESSLHPEDKERAIKELKEALAGNKEFNTVFRIMPPGHKKPLFIKAKGKVQRDKNGKALAIYGTNWDVTHEMQLAKKYEDALNHLKDTQSQLIQSEKMASLGLLTAGIAHEINNPLNYIWGGHLSINDAFEGQDSVPKETIEPYLDWIQQGTQRASEIVKSLSLFTRTNSDQHESCDINEVVEDCLLVMKHSYKNRIQINKRLTETPLLVKGNNGRLRQAVLNLISNAVDAIEKTGTIDLETQDLGSKISIRIEDSGHGIKAKDLEKIMDPFFTTKPPGKGTGLGLSITKSIVEEHQGELHFQSNENQGTICLLTLPKPSTNE